MSCFVGGAKIESEEEVELKKKDVVHKYHEYLNTDSREKKGARSKRSEGKRTEKKENEIRGSKVEMNEV